MAAPVKRSYNNSRRQAQSRATNLRIVQAAKALFIDDPATTLEAVADVADTSLPTLYRLFSSKRALLKAVLDTSFGSDDQPVAFGDRPEVKAARSQRDPVGIDLERSLVSPGTSWNARRQSCTFSPPPPKWTPKPRSS